MHGPTGTPVETPRRVAFEQYPDVDQVLRPPRRRVSMTAAASSRSPGEPSGGTPSARSWSGMPAADCAARPSPAAEWPRLRTVGRRSAVFPASRRAECLPGRLAQVGLSFSGGRALMAVAAWAMPPARPPDRANISPRGSSSCVAKRGRLAGSSARAQACASAAAFSSPRRPRRTERKMLKALPGHGMVGGLLAGAGGVEYPPPLRVQGQGWWSGCHGRRRRGLCRRSRSAA